MQFAAFFADAPAPLFVGSRAADAAAADGCWRLISDIFTKLQEYRPFEILHRVRRWRALSRGSLQCHMTVACRVIWRVCVVCHAAVACRAAALTFFSADPNKRTQCPSPQGRDRAKYLLTKEAKIIAMTCTHAALVRRDLVEMGFSYDNVVMEEAAQVLYHARALGSDPWPIA